MRVVGLITKLDIWPVHVGSPYASFADEEKQRSWINWRYSQGRGAGANRYKALPSVPHLSFHEMKKFS